MNILFLGPKDSPLVLWLEKAGETVTPCIRRLIPGRFHAGRYDFMVSYGYPHLVPKRILDQFPGKAINLHISYLPWNRGSDPNFWSWIDDTPKGVSIHHMDAGIDTGDILYRQKVRLAESRHTLATSYAALHKSLQSLFRRHWDQIRSGWAPRIKQGLDGTYHAQDDRKALDFLLKAKRWDTPVRELVLAGEDLAVSYDYMRLHRWVA